MTSIHSRSHNIGINKFIKIGSDNKLKKFYLKNIVYKRGFNLVLYIVGKDQWHTTMFGFMMNRAGTTFMKKKLEEFSSFDPQSCVRHTGSSLYIHKNQINWTRNCHAPAMALSSKYILQSEIPDTTIPYIDNVPIRGPTVG